MRILGLFEERAILLGKLGRHEQALSIYINIINDMPAAIEFCNICYQSDPLVNKEVLLFYFKLCAEIITT